MSKYTDLITSEHTKRPKFVATVEATTDPEIDIQNATTGLIAAFDLDTAVGAQLDVVGEWVGISRYILTPLTGVYFAWGTPGVGWGQGYWRAPYDPLQGLTTLTDDFYRLLIRATIALNNWDGTIQPAIEAITPLFPKNYVYVQDNQDMSISVAISGEPPDVISTALLTGGYLALKPATVRIKYFFPTAPSGPVFGFGGNNDYIGGWGRGSWGASSPFTA